MQVTAVLTSENGTAVIDIFDGDAGQILDGNTTTTETDVAGRRTNRN
ncbi:hypothetical protein O9992_20330 [Vibrio lentus]|nr:hypothetical protein [Vibrio lentus]